MLVVIGFYWPAVFHEFVNWDDPVYVVENNLLKLPLREAIPQIFSSFFQGHYHPLSLCSLAFDYTLFGPNSGAFIAHNIFLHALASCLLFVFLARQLGQRNIAFAVTLFFAIHPLRLESVVWIAERKDVLFMCWFLAALVAFQSFAATANKKWFWVSYLCFVVALLSKSTALLLPFFLLLVLHQSIRNVLKSALSLWPFWILSAIVGFVALKAVSSGSGAQFEWVQHAGLPTSLVAMGWYWGAVLLPIKLAVLYPFQWKAAQLSMAVLGASLIVAALVWSFRKKKYQLLQLTLLGIITLLPFLPISGVLLSPFNDRYTYLFSVVVSWFIGQLLVNAQAEKSKYFKISAAVVLLIYGGLFWQKLPAWQNSETLWSNVLTIDSENYFAYLNRAQYYGANGQIQPAKDDLLQANRMNPDALVVIDNLYTLAIQSQQIDEVVKWGSLLFDKKPSIVLANEIALLAYNAKQLDVSLDFYKKSIAINANQPDVEINLALIAFQKGDLAATESHLKTALQIQPDHVPTLEKLATFYYQQSRLADACELLQKAKNLGSAKAAQMAEQVCGL